MLYVCVDVCVLYASAKFSWSSFYFILWPKDIFMLFWQRFFYDYDVMGVLTVNNFSFLVLGLFAEKQQKIITKKDDWTMYHSITIQYWYCQFIFMIWLSPNHFIFLRSTLLVFLLFMYNVALIIQHNFNVW